MPGTSSSWLAVLLLDADELPSESEPRQLTAADLVTLDRTISVLGSDATGRGRLPDRYLSYPNINPLDYGERPDQELVAVDLPVELFSRVAPSAADLALLAHVREGDTVDVEDTAATVAQRALVLGNRVPQGNRPAQALLVSLEHLGPYLPADDGTPSRALAAFTHVRLTVLRAWTSPPTCSARPSSACSKGSTCRRPSATDGSPRCGCRSPPPRRAEPPSTPR